MVDNIETKTKRRVVFRHGEGLFRKEAVEARGRQMISDNIVPSSIPRWIVPLFIICAVTLLFFTLLFGSYTKKSVIRGKIVFKKGVSELVNLTPGTVIDVKAQISDSVTKNQILFTVNTAGDQSDGNRTLDAAAENIESQKSSIKIELDQTLATLQNKQNQQAERIRFLESKGNNIRAEINEIIKQIELAQKLEAKFSKLFQDDTASELELIQVREKLFGLYRVKSQLLQKVDTNNLELNAAKYELTSAKISMEQAREISIRETLGLENEIIGLKRQGHQEYASPVDGKIGSILFQKNQSVGQGNLLATIVPKDNELVTRFYVTSEVIKNITTGDEIRVKIEAYPPEKFGTLSARVYEVSGTDISSEKLNLSNDYNAGLYILKVEFTDTFQALHSRGITLEPGMNVSGTIVEENFKFWQLILGPILDS